MAFWYWFTCPSCGYITKASGARANGLAASVDTMVCRDCDELVDILIDARPRWMEIIDPHWMERLDTCPQCHGRNLEEWSPAFPCPRCGTTVERVKVSQRSTHFCPRCQSPPKENLKVEAIDSGGNMT